MILGDLIYHINWSGTLNRWTAEKAAQDLAASTSRMMIALSKSCYVKLQDGRTWRWGMGIDMCLHEEKSEWDRSRLLLTKVFDYPINTSNNSPKIAWRRTSNDQFSQSEPSIESENGQNKQRIFTIDLNLGWSILTAETQIFCSIYLVVLIRGSFPETHVHLMYFFSILRNLWRN